MIADNPDRFAGEVAALLCDVALRDALGKSARLLVERRFSWERVVRDLETIYRMLGAPGGTCKEKLVEPRCLLGGDE